MKLHTLIPAIVCRLLLALLLVGTGAAHAQAPTWQTALALNAVSSNVTGMATDAAGNVYLTGRFVGTLSLGSIALTSQGGDDGFVAKYRPATGTFAWAQRFGGTGADQGHAVAVAGSSVYVTGTFEGTATFGAISFSSAGASDAAVFKLVDQGTTAAVVWAQRAGGSRPDNGYAVAVSGTSVYLGGAIGGAADFGPLTLPNAGYFTGFVAKLTDTGASAAFGWVQALSGPGYTDVNVLAATATSVYAGGLFVNSTTFGSATLTGTGAEDGWVAKLNDNGPSGSVSWAVPLGGSGSDELYSLAVSGPNVYATGRFSGTAWFGSLALTSAGSSDVFVAKLTDAGASAAYTWVQPAGGPGDDFGSAVAVAGGSVYVTGGIVDAGTFGSIPVMTAGTHDVFVARLADAGASARFVWAQVGGGSQGDFGTALALSSQGLYVGGVVSPPATFAPLAALAGDGSGVGVGLLAGLGRAALATTPAAPVPAFGLLPNPAHGMAMVRLPAGLGAATLTVLDVLGRAVRSQTTTEAHAELDLTGLPAGLYAVRVAAGNQAITQRLVVE
ncbi:hypothetical protein GCM10028824_27430 [Hymenobacter segetis]|uniref:T9SS type A sorting domain-containing protein n=1 Tax=Hymenobacter segetis TaxID=2025509 RepID=A0ABU9M0L2_9BACT